MKITYLLFVLCLLAVEDNLKIDFGQEKGGQDWQVINDGVMGGLSQGKAYFQENGIVFNGEISLANYGGFSSFKSPFQTFDLSKYEKVEIRMRSKGQRFAFTLEVDERFFMPYFKQSIPIDSEDWQTIELTLSQFQEYRLGNATGAQIGSEKLSQISRIGFINEGKKEGPFAAEIDYILFH